MTIYAYAHSIGARIKIYGKTNTHPQWLASFDSCEVKDGGFLVGKYGVGETKRCALSDYLDQIKGKMIVFHAYSAERKEFIVPNDITID